MLPEAVPDASRKFNYEWAFGYAPTFGLVAVDRQTFTRQPRQSASWLGSVAHARVLPIQGELAQSAGGAATEPVSSV